MKKYLFSALALPLLFACSSDDLIEKEVASNDQFAGIEKVDATFSMDEGVITRFDKGAFVPEEGDKWGFAWLTDAHTAEPAYTASIAISGKAYQNHNLVQTNGIFTPQTSIYVGKYFLYRPYDDTTVSPQPINFNSLKEQPMAKGYESSTDAWKALAKTLINIGDHWTEVTPKGKTIDNFTWNKAGIEQHYELYGAVFSNQTGLDLKYTKNIPTFDEKVDVIGATDIDYDIAAGEKGLPADIYGATVQLQNAANSFTYGPTAEPNATGHSGTFWANKKKSTLPAGFTFNDAAPIVLKAPAAIPADGTEGWFWFNSLPVTSNDAATLATTIVTTIKTSFGTVTIDKKKVNNVESDLTIGDCAWVFDAPAEGATKEWMKLAAETKTTVSPKEWSIENNTFVNQFGNHKGKYLLNVDFSTAVMDIHITDDAHLQKYLLFYLASKKNQGATLILDGDDDNSFKLSKISIALLQTINGAPNVANKVLVVPCKLEDHNAPQGGFVKIIVTQDGQADKDLADAKGVPALNNVFFKGDVIFDPEAENPTAVAVPATPVYLAAKNSDGTDITWTWGDEIGEKVNGKGNGILPIDANVASITNEGTVDVTNANVQLSVAGVPLYNENGATMNFTAVTTVKNPLTNLGEINVSAGAELRAYGIAITNDAKTLPAPYHKATEAEPDVIVGVINNSGVVGVTYNTNGTFNNYGLIDMKTQNSMTLLTRNQTPAPAGTFKNAFKATGDDANKLGTVKLPGNNPFAIVSVSNLPETGFIEYEWNDGATYATPETPGGIVKYNTLVVSSDIAFTAQEPEIQYIRFTSDEMIKVTNPQGENFLNNLKGIIVTNGTKVLIEKFNKIYCTTSAYVGTGATIYNGGQFTPNATVNNETKVATNYLGTWSTDQVVVF